jgi:hypothetical protein
MPVKSGLAVPLSSFVGSIAVHAAGQPAGRCPESHVRMSYAAAWVPRNVTNCRKRPAVMLYLSSFTPPTGALTQQLSLPAGPQVSPPCWTLQDGASTHFDA